MTRFLGLLLVTATLSLGSCQCSNKPDVGPVEESESAHLIETNAIDTVHSVNAAASAVLTEPVASSTART